MNMPIMGDNTVLFTATLFALIRTSLGIFSHGDPSYADTDLRRTIKKLWPKTSKKTLDKMIPMQSVLSSQQMTVGKIYCAKLIYENYKHLKRRRLEDGKKNKPSRRPSLFKRFFGALRSGTSNSEDSENELRPPPGLLTHRRRSKTMDSIPTFSKEKLDSIQPKRRMHRSLKFFRRPFGRTGSNSEDEEIRRMRKSVRFKDAPMDLTDINPTIVSTDNEEEEQTETTQKKRKTVKHSYKNPVAIEDAENEIYSSTESPSHSSADIRTPPLVRIHSSSPLTLDVDSLDQSSSEDRNHLRLDPFPDVIKSAESSPRHSLASNSEFFARARLHRNPKDQRSNEVINQLNEEISQAVRSGQSAYCIFGMFDNDEETWC